MLWPYHADPTTVSLANDGTTGPVEDHCPRYAMMSNWPGTGVSGKLSTHLWYQHSLTSLNPHIWHSHCSFDDWCFVSAGPLLWNMSPAQTVARNPICLVYGTAVPCEVFVKQSRSEIILLTFLLCAVVTESEWAADQNYPGIGSGKCHQSVFRQWCCHPLLPSHPQFCRCTFDAVLKCLP